MGDETDTNFNAEDINAVDEINSKLFFDTLKSRKIKCEDVAPHQKENYLMDGGEAATKAKKMMEGMPPPMAGGGKGNKKWPSLSTVLDGIVKFLINIFLLIVFTVIFYICYLIYTYGYPRLFSFGHSEPFEEGFMPEYMKNLLKAMDDIKKLSSSPSSNEDIDNQVKVIKHNVKEIDEGFRGYVYGQVEIAKKAVETFEAKYEEVVSGVNKGGNPKLSYTNVKKNDMPDFYLLFMFYDALISKDKDALMYMNKFYKHNIVAHYFEEDTTTQLKKDAISKLQDLAKAFDECRNTIGSASKALQDFTHAQIGKIPPNDISAMLLLFKLDIYMNLYVDGKLRNKEIFFRDNITKSYDMRKAGGLGNTTVFKIYMMEYVEYMFDGKYGVIPVKWKSFIPDINDTAMMWFDSFTSEKTQAYVANIPLKLAGMEDTFKNKPEVVEHFGFLMKIFGPIVNTFTALYKIVTGIIKVISSPLSFFKALIGLIIGVLIMITYAILVVIGLILFYPAAFIMVLWWKLWSTWVWLVIYVIICLVYIILWFLDTLCNGAVFSMLRCENLPDAWHKRAGFESANVFERTFVCSRPCGNRYKPWGPMCLRKDKEEPTYCPQSMLYDVFNGKSKVLNGNYVYEFVPTLEYYNISINERKALWSEAFDKKKEYINTCLDGMEEFNHVSKAVCHYYANMDPKGIPESMTTVRQKVMNMCEQTYCDRFVKRKNNGLASWCNLDKEKSEEGVPPPSSKPDVITNVILIVIILIMIIAAFIGIYNTAGVRPPGGVQVE